MPVVALLLAWFLLAAPVAAADRVNISHSAVSGSQAILVELATLGNLGLDYIGTSLATRQTIQKKENLVRRFVRAIVENIHFFKREKEASIQLIAKFNKLTDRAALEEAYNIYAFKYMARVPYPILKGVETIWNISQKQSQGARRRSQALCRAALSQRARGEWFRSAAVQGE